MKPESEVRRHGEGPPIDVSVWLGDDPELALVYADMNAWADAHPCDCEALCVCDQLPKEQR